MKKILIAGFLAAIILLAPLGAAISLPLNENEQKTFQELINKEEKDLQTKLQTIVEDVKQKNGELDLDTIEEQLLQAMAEAEAGSSITDTDSWDWVTERLGWIYLTSEQVLALYNSGTLIFATFAAKYGVLVGWYNSVTAFMETWKAFKDNPSNFQAIIDLINAAGSLVTFTTTIIYDLLDGEQELINALNDFKDQLQEFTEFMGNDPWLQSIEIYGIVDGVETDATVTCNENSVNANGEYSLLVPTENEDMPWWIHQCSITATYNAKTKNQNSYSFSMGRIEANFDFSGSKSIDMRYISLFERLPLLKQIFSILYPSLF